VVIRKLGVLAHSMHLQIAVLVRNAVDVHRPVAALGRDIFIQRVPGNALHEVVMLGQLVKTLPCLGVSSRTLT
jgi:hypothetical protein